MSPTSMSVGELTMIVKEKFILIDFHATWCGPCKQIAPYLESLACQHPDDLIIVKVRIAQGCFKFS